MDTVTRFVSRSAAALPLRSRRSDTFCAMHPVHIMPKPAGSACNLNCAYCYYLEKQKLYAESPKQEMSDETLERYIHDYIAIQP